MSKFSKIVNFFSICCRWLIMIGGLLGVGVLPVQAKDALGLTLTPPVSYLYVKPGAGISQTLTLKNDGQYSLKVTPQIVDFQTAEQTGDIVLGQKTTFPYISIAGDQQKWGESFYLKPNEEKTIPLVIAVPSDFPPAEHHQSVLFQAQQLLSGSQTGETSIAGIIASNLVIMVASDTNNHGKLEVADVRIPRFVDSFFGISWQIIVKNSGANATPLTGNLTLSHWPDGQLEQYQVYPDMVLANSQRLLRAMTDEKIKELQKLESSKDTMTATGQDFAVVKGQFVDENLRSQFIYKPAFLLGAYDLEIQVGDQLLKKRVIALPFTFLGIALLMPVLYAVLQFLVRNRQSRKSPSKNT